MHEKDKNKKLPVIEFIPEGYIATSGQEFLEQLETRLVQAGMDPKDLVYSGIDGSFLQKNEEPHRPKAIFAMNRPGWLEAVRIGEETPADYAKGQPVHCIGLFDKRQLQEAYSYEFIEGADPSDPIELENIVPGEKLADMPDDYTVTEVVLHQDYPNASPIDALVGYAIFE